MKMLELQQDSITGNLPKPYSSSSWSREESRVFAQPKDGSSGTKTSSTTTTKFRCNNCNLEAPIEQLRVETTDPRYTVHLPGMNNGVRNMDRPRAYRDTLLCNPCKRLFDEWLNDGGSYRNIGPFTGPRTVPLSDLSKWCRVNYWIHQKPPREITSTGLLPIQGRQVSLGAATGTTASSSQDLR